MSSITEQFPQKVDLGHEETVCCAPCEVPKPTTKKYYPRVYLRDVEGLDIPKRRGQVVFDYRRCRFSIEDGPDGKPVVCIELELETAYFQDKGEGADKLSQEIAAAVESQDGKESDDDEEGEEY